MPTRRDFHKLSIAAAMAALPGVGLGQSAAEPRNAVPVRQRRGDLSGTVRSEVYGTHGVVAAGTQYTVEAGRRILAAGGNAFDAGVAAVLAAAVNEFSHFGMGGEAPAIVCEAATGKVTVICGQGTAPKAATPAYFMEAGVIPGNGPNGGTVPAVIDSMALALQTFGTLSLAQVMAPALELADGFPMYGMLRYTLEANRENTEQWEWAKRTYYPEGRLAEVGELFRQPNLAATLRAVLAADPSPNAEKFIDVMHPSALGARLIGAGVAVRLGAEGWPGNDLLGRAEAVEPRALSDDARSYALPSPRTESAQSMLFPPEDTGLAPTTVPPPSPFGDGRDGVPPR